MPSNTVAVPVRRAGLPAKRKQADAYDAEYDRGKQKKVRGARAQDAWQELGAPGSGGNMFESAWQSRSGGGHQQHASPGSGGGRKGHRGGRGGRGSIRGGGSFRGRGSSSPGRGRCGGGFRGGRGGR